MAVEGLPHHRKIGWRPRNRKANSPLFTTNLPNDIDDESKHQQWTNSTESLIHCPKQRPETSDREER